MKVTYNWLKDFVEIKIPARALAEKLTMAGLEVTSLEEKKGDFIFEIEVTSNRPDWLSVFGIAREVAAITHRRLRAYNAGRLAYSKKLSAGAFKIHIENKKDCPLYTAKIIKEVKVGPSPDWLKNRLELLGCRSVNNIVDITNYVLFETGEPLHAFDLDKLKEGSIVVRRAKAGERITTIDGQEKTLDPGILVIADKEKSVAVAGVMGSKDTEVAGGTRNILLEAAVFNPVVIRRGRRDFGIQSESSYRFERGVNPAVVNIASMQAARLIIELAGGKCVLAKSSGPLPSKRKSISLNLDAVNKILGINIASADIKKILTSLEFKTRIKPKSNFLAEVPQHRPDIALDIDLIEEIARIYGFENFPQTLPAVKPCVSAREARDAVSLIKNILIGLGLNEVITYSLMDKDLLRDFAMYQGFEAVEILNPLSNEQEILRPGLLPGLVACIAYNLNQKQEYVNIFETAKVFSQGAGSLREELMLGVVLCGKKSLLLKDGAIKEPAGLLNLKGILETLFARLGVREYNFNAAGNACAVAINIAGEKIGFVAELDKGILDKLEIKNKEVFALELSLESLLSFVNLDKKFFPLPVYPGITRDISLLLKTDILVGDLLKAIKVEGGSLLKEAGVTDYYRGKQIPAGFKGLTLSCLYRSDERTLTEAEINPAHARICAILTERFGAQIR